MINFLINRYNNLLLFFQRDFLKSVEDNLYSHRDQLILWAPILMGLGIGLFFSLEYDPASYWILLPLIGLLSLSIIKPYVLRLLALMLFWVSLGFSVTLVRTELLQTPILDKPIKKLQLSGTIKNIETHPAGLRITLQPSHLGVKALRFVIQQQYLPPVVLNIGDKIQTVVNVFPPSSTVHPDGYDFRRASYFQSIGGVGYAIRRVVLLSQAQTNLINKLLNTVQQSIRTTIIHDLEPKNAAIALALTLGDKRAIPDEIRKAYANSGIAHLLAISGLHLTIIAGFLFFLIRRGLSLFQIITLKYNTKKWAAVAAFIFTSSYLALCWGSVSALRAYLMAGIVFLAILLDRQAITLRSVSLAAIAILLFWPESLLTPSFQLSFAAVTGIVAAYQSRPTFVSDKSWKKSLRFVLGIMITTGVATLATIPFTLYHFQQFSLYGLWVNALAIPLTSFVLMPTLFCYVLLIPFGWHSLLLRILEQTISLLNQLALSVQQLPFASLTTPSISASVTIVLTFSLLWIVLWRHKIRYTGFLGIPVAFFLWFVSPQPLGFIDFDNNIFAVKESGKLMVSHYGQNFIIDQWKAYTQTTSSHIIPCHQNHCKKQIANHEIIWNKKGLKYLSNSGYDLQQENSQFVILAKNQEITITHLKPHKRIWSRK